MISYETPQHKIVWIQDEFDPECMVIITPNQKFIEYHLTGSFACINLRGIQKANKQANDE